MTLATGSLPAVVELSFFFVSGGVVALLLDLLNVAVVLLAFAKVENVLTSMDAVVGIDVPLLAISGDFVEFTFTVTTDVFESNCDSDCKELCVVLGHFTEFKVELNISTTAGCVLVSMISIGRVILFNFSEVQMPIADLFSPC